MLSVTLATLPPEARGVGQQSEPQEAQSPKPPVAPQPALSPLAGPQAGSCHPDEPLQVFLEHASLAVPRHEALPAGPLLPFSE